MAVKILYYVHSTTVDNENKRASGWNETLLSEKGLSQAQDLAKIVKNENIDAIFCSDLIRAVESAKIVFKDLGKEIQKDERLRECNYGELNGKDSKLIEYTEHIENPFPNGESLTTVEKRVKILLDEIKEKYQGKTVAIMAHRATQLAIEVLTQGKSWEEAIATDWRNTKDWKPGWEYNI
ncbi:MAG: histidine phosphatase family protein [Clostridia bacterium]|nr:histidine phosphatase family protein [Clostridia bacterium]